jgi:hypothetical protein
VAQTVPCLQTLRAQIGSNEEGSYDEQHCTFVTVAVVSRSTDLRAGRLQGKGRIVGTSVYLIGRPAVEIEMEKGEKEGAKDVCDNLRRDTLVARLGDTREESP